jgi:hypothetical protein
MPDDIKHSHMVSPAHAAASAAARAAPLNFSTPETSMSEDPSALTPAIAAQASNPVCLGHHDCAEHLHRQAP